MLINCSFLRMTLLDIGTVKSHSGFQTESLLVTLTMLSVAFINLLRHGRELLLDSTDGAFCLLLDLEIQCRYSQII